MDKFMQFYQDLQKEYDITLSRRKDLNTQAISMMNFSGVIVTVLMGIIVAIATNNDARAFFTSSLNFPYLATLIGIGFSSVTLAAIVALIAYWETSWLTTPVLPRMLSSDSASIKDVVDIFYNDESKINFKLFAMQVAKANLLHGKANRTKFVLLNLASILLVSGVIVTAIAGFALMFLILI
jgi:hypothetical protein